MRALGLLVATMLALLGADGHAAVTVQASLDPPRVAVGETSDLSVEVRGTQSAGTPSVPAPDGLAIQYVGPSTQLSIVNGQTSASVTHHFAVTPRRQGTFTIGPITVLAEGQALQAGTVVLQVAAGGAGSGDGEGELLRLELRAPRTTVYLHERVPFTLSLLVGAVRVGDVQYPQVSGDGFALEPLGQPAQRQETRDGNLVQVVDFQGALSPLRTGAVTVGPATMSLSLLTDRARQRHGFFFGGAARQPVELASQPLVLDVLPLPEAGKPADFSGAVGRFSLSVRAAPLDPAAGDPVTLTYTLRGDGDLSSATPPALAAGDGLRVYPVQSSATPKGAPAGTRVFEQVVIPEQPGAVTLPAVRFSWFDPEARAYRSAAPAPITLTVRPAPEGSRPQIVGAPAGRATESPEALGRDIVFVKDAPDRLAPVAAHRWRSPFFWAMQLIPLLGWLVVVAIDRRRQRLGTDTRYARFTRAGRAARAALERARRAIERGDPADFHDTVARAIADYLAAKLDLPPGAVTAEAAGARLRASGLPDGVAAELQDFLAGCELARFAPVAAGDGDLRRTLARAEEIVRTLERSRRLLPAATAAAVALLLVAGVGRAAGEDTPQATFFRANALYADGRYDEAAAAYERLLTTGVASANTYFNLGNAYLKAGRIGPAVLAYERAGRLAPGDPDLRANLVFAREQSAVEGTPRPWWARILFPLAASWSSDQLLLGVAVAWWALLLVAIVRRLAPRARRAASRAAAAAGVMLVVLGASAAYRLATVDLRRTAVVVAPAEVAVRFEPSASGTVHFQVKPGATLRLLAERDGWVQVGRDDGLRGWVERDAVGEV